MALISLNNLERFFNNLKTYISNALSSKANTSHTHTSSDITSGLATVATSGSYNDLSNKPTIPSKTSDLTNDSCIPLSGTYNITGTDFFKDANTSFILISGGHAWNTGAHIGLAGGAKSENPGTFTLQACKTDGIFYRLIGYPNGTLTWGSKNVAMAEDVIPRSGGAVMDGRLYMTTNASRFAIGGGTKWYTGGSIELFGNEETESYRGMVRIQPALSDTSFRKMELRANGTWTWDGTACQITSDQRYKQQISEIDDKLLDAWADVNLVQFKYNDAVDQKGDNARLHTGYVVQQISEACQKHNIDISDYGLYCHEVYPEKTEEVEVENEDGTTTKETKVIEEAKEHYSLRYTECLVVECAYLRKQIELLQERLNKLEGK